MCAAVVIGEPDYEGMWQRFKEDYKKEYPVNSNEAYRFQIFKSNVDLIEKINSQNKSYSLGVNMFADLTWDEFSKTHLGYSHSGVLGKLPHVPFPNITAGPDSIDWVQKGAVTPLKNQASCGSCWAFSTTGSIEGAYFVSSGKLVSLSEQDLVSCDHNGDMGCLGGDMDRAFQWVSKNGICTEEDYPYTSGGGQTGSCVKTCTPSVTLTGHTDVPPMNENALKAAVSQQPISVAIEADKDVFQHYKSGILDDPACGTNLDHGVLIVGFGTQNGKDYWKVKNSWGASWGQSGYVLMARGRNQCGIAQQATYPTGVTAASGPSPGPSPPSPPPPPPRPGQTHYGKPPCRNDETDEAVPSAYGVVCGAHCNTDSDCPTDKPGSATGKPTCTMDGACVLTCYGDSDCDASGGAHCHLILPFATAACTYGNSSSSVIV